MAEDTLLLNSNTPSVTSESFIKCRDILTESFRSRFFEDPKVFVRAPGRAELIGNHTDYNHGYAIGCAISSDLLVLAAPRQDGRIVAVSESFPDLIEEFSISDLAFFLNAENEKNSQDGNGRSLNNQSLSWGRYVAAVTLEFYREAPDLLGMNLLIYSEIPFGSGVSSSAALEVGVALAIQAINDIQLTAINTAVLCQRAENGPLVGSPCGILDQACVMLPKAGEVLFFNFKKSAIPSPQTHTIQVDFAAAGLQLVITVDQSVRRDLGTSGYPARRKSCEIGVKLLSKLLDRSLLSLSEISVQEFSTITSQIDFHGGKELAHRIEHVISENARVCAAKEALLGGDFITFGSLLSASGKSALELYNVDEGTPELTFLVKEARTMNGVLGTRNMGGGFSALTLTLIHTHALSQFQEGLNDRYMRTWQRPLAFLPFSPSQHAEIK